MLPLSKSSSRDLLLVSLLALALVPACRASRVGEGTAPSVTTGADRCARFQEAINLDDRIATLNTLSKAFAERCDRFVLEYGAQAQTQFRAKTFSISRETTNLFIPDGTLVEYVLESYERGYLTFLLAAGYHRLGRDADATVEIRRLDHEIISPLYNYGEDPVNVLLMAAMWELQGNLAEARVDWNRLHGQPDLQTDLSKPIREFAGRRSASIDAGHAQPASWAIYGVGRFPAVSWDLEFFNSTTGYFSVYPGESFPEDCVSSTGLRLSTRSWFKKIAHRHDHAYHPLLHAQSWIRLPLGVTYSLVPLAGGAGMIVGGCALDFAGNEGRGVGNLCQISISAGMALASTAPDVLRWALEPDLRHWEEVPAAIVVTTAKDRSLEPCLTDLSDYHQRPMLKLAEKAAAPAKGLSAP
jgi:hypothetical protein